LTTARSGRSFASISLAPSHPLLERDREIAALAEAARTVADGHGAAIAIRGRAGIGKTSLVETAHERAAAAGLTVASVRAGELERELGWGIAVDAVDALIDMIDTDRELLLSGRARPAAAILDEAPSLDELVEFAPAQQAAIVAALTLVVGRLAALRPIAVLADDVHWADPLSLRWLCHLAARAPQLPLMLVVALRPSEPGSWHEGLGQLDETASLRLAPAPLTQAATAELFGGALGDDADSETSGAVHEVTAGNPFLIDQLVRHFDAGPVTADEVRRARPERLGAMLEPRLARLGPDVRALADAVAVLGVDVELRHAREVAGLSREAATDAYDRLVAAGLFADGLPLSFAHPLLRETVLGALSAAAAEDLHRRAAEVLADPDAPTAAAVHLLATEPVGESWAADLLVAAGRRAMTRSAYESAAAFFERALREPPAATPRHRIALWQGRALVLAARDEGFAVLRDALDETPDPAERAEIALEVGGSLMAVDRPREALAAYERGVAAAADADATVRIGLLAERALSALALRDDPAQILAAISEAMDATAAAPDLAGRAALGLVGIVAVWSGDDAARCTELLERALEAPPHGRRDALEWTPDLAWLMAGLAWCDAHARRDAFLDAVIARASERGAMLDVALATAWRSYGRMRQGKVADAEDDARFALALYVDLDDAHHAMVSAFLLDALLARGAYDEAQQLLDHAPPHSDDDQIVYLALLDARARLRIAQGRLEEARDDLELIRAETERHAFQCPAAVRWRPLLAVVEHELGDHAAAHALAAQDIELTRAFGAPRARGLALLAAATIAEPREALELLAEADEVLAPSPAALEHAQALYALGVANRRLGRRGEATELLRRCLDGAARCGADALARAARSELRVLGARPRRERISGPESLTAAERRVAELAAAGATNAQIARELVVSARTVETHLTSIYRKLDINRRGELAARLEDDQAQ